jgi:hypothetical protein
VYWEEGAPRGYGGQEPLSVGSKRQEEQNSWKHLVWEKVKVHNEVTDRQWNWGTASVDTGWMPLHIPGGHAVCPTCKRKLFSGDRAQWDHIYNWKLFGPNHPLLLALTEYTLLSAPLSHFLLHAYITWSFCSSHQSFRVSPLSFLSLWQPFSP